MPKFMQKVLTGYAMYFNRKYLRQGRLFQGVFKSEHLDTDEYLKYIYSYILLNPAKLKDKDWKEKCPRDLNILREFILGYKYSSIDELLYNEPSITNPSAFPNYQDNYKSQSDYFKTIIDNWLGYKIQR